MWNEARRRRCELCPRGTTRPTSCGDSRRHPRPTLARTTSTAQERGQREPAALGPITVLTSFFYTKLTEAANGGYYYHNGGVQR
jgi:hypothetical protein